MNDRAFDLVVSRDALNAIYNGPDGIKGTADDTDAILALGNNFAAAPAKAGFPSVTCPEDLFWPIQSLRRTIRRYGPVSPDRHLLGPGVF
jgi:hypothetical protein